MAHTLMMTSGSAIMRLSTGRLPVGCRYVAAQLIRKLTARCFESLLKSYINSGYKLDIHVGWMHWNVSGNANKAVRVAGMTLGRMLSMVPNLCGNSMTAIIRPGDDVPPSPEPFGEL